MPSLKRIYRKRVHDYALRGLPSTYDLTELVIGVESFDGRLRELALSYYFTRERDGQRTRRSCHER